MANLVFLSCSYKDLLYFITLNRLNHVGWCMLEDGPEGEVGQLYSVYGFLSMDTTCFLF